MPTGGATLKGRLAREPVLEFRSITKFYPGVLANDVVILVLNRGEVLGVPGGHGAGKSTSMNFVSGLTPPEDAGRPRRQRLSSGILHRRRLGADNEWLIRDK